jgi:hypothetical protein
MDWIDHKCIRECLKELSDKSYQERVWTASSGPEISSFVEAVCQLYGGTGLDAAFDKGHQVYGKEIDGLLKNFETILQSIPDRRPPSELIQDEKMIPVRKMAEDILQLIERRDRENQPA